MVAFFLHIRISLFDSLTTYVRTCTMFLTVCVCNSIDNIEANVETAAVRVEGGNRQLEKAVSHKVRSCVTAYCFFLCSNNASAVTCRSQIYFTWYLCCNWCLVKYCCCMLLCAAYASKISLPAITMQYGSICCFKVKI